MMPRRGPGLVPFAVPAAPLPWGFVAPAVLPFAPALDPDGTPVVVPEVPATRPLRMLVPAPPFAVASSAAVVATEPFAEPPLRTPMPAGTGGAPPRAAPPG